MLKGIGKRFLAGALTLCMLLGPAAPLTPRASAANGAEGTSGSIGQAFGFSDSIPADIQEDLKNLDDNPYGKQAGQGKWVNFNPVKELNIFRGYPNQQSSTVYEMDESSYGSWFPYEFDGVPGSFNQPGTDMLDTDKNGDYTRFVNGVAFDPTGSGRDSYVAYYGFDQKDAFRPKLYVADANDPNHFDSGWTAISASDDTRDYNAQRNINYAKYKGYTSIVAGDFDGTGEDTLVLYHNRNAAGDGYPALELLEFEVGEDEPAGMWASAQVYDISEGYEKMNSQADRDTKGGVLTKFFGQSPGWIAKMSSRSDAERLRNTVMVQLAAGDVDGDNADELIVTVSLPNLVLENSADFLDRSSVVMVLDKSGSGWSVLSSWQLTDAKLLGEKTNSKSYNGTGGWFMRSASSYVGDIDGDNMPEVVSSGFLFDDRNHADDDMDGTVGAAIAIADCSSGGAPSPRRTIINNDLTALTAWPVYVDRGYLSEWDEDASEGPISLALAALEGTGTREYAVIHGELFQYVGGSANGNDGELRERALGNYEYLALMTPTQRQRVTYPVVGNFDGNQEGREQVFLITFYPMLDWECLVSFGISADLSSMDDDDYKLSVGNVDMGIQCLTTVHSGYSVALTAPDVDEDDGLFVQMKEKLYEFSDVEVMAVLEATPYFGDLADEYNETLGSTGFGLSAGQGSGTVKNTSTSAGIYVSFEQEIAFVATVGSAEIETAVTSEWSEEVAQSTEYEYDIDFDAGRDAHRVVLTRTPVIVYDYYVWDPATNPGDRPVTPDEDSGLSTMHISQAQQPAYTTMDLEEYNSLAAAYGKTDELIAALPSIPGEPSSYRKDYAGLNAASYGSFVSTGSGSSTVTQSIDVGQAAEFTTSQSHSISVSAGGGAFGFVIGVSGEASSSTARSVTNTESVTRFATVADVPAGHPGYGFQWQMITYDISLKSGTDSYSVPVVGYIVQNVKQPPSLPTDITATPEIEAGEPMVELTWASGYIPAAKYEIYRYLENDQTGIHYYRLGTVSGTDRAFIHSGNLEEGAEYNYCIRAFDSEGSASTYSAPVSVITPKSDGSSPIIRSQPQDQTVPVGETAVFTISASPGAGSKSVNFGWQQRIGNGGWEKLAGEDGNTLTVSNVTKDMDGAQYRCLVSSLPNSAENISMIYSDIVTLRVAEQSPPTIAMKWYTDSSRENPTGGPADTVFTTTGTKNETVNVTYDITVSSVKASYVKYTNGQSGQPDIYVSGGKYYIMDGFSGGEPVIDAGNKTATVTATAAGRTELQSFSGMLTRQVEGSDVLVANVSDLHSTVIQTEVLEIDGEKKTYQRWTATGVAREDFDTEAAYSSGRLNLYRPVSGESADRYYVYFAGPNGQGALQEVTVKMNGDDPATSYDTAGEGEDKKEVITEGDNMTYLQNTLTPVYVSDQYEYVDASGTAVGSDEDGQTGIPDGAAYAVLKGGNGNTIYQKIENNALVSSYYIQADTESETSFIPLTAMDGALLGTCGQETLGGDASAIPPEEGTVYTVVTPKGSLGAMDTATVPAATTSTTLRKGSALTLQLYLTPPEGKNSIAGQYTVTFVNTATGAVTTRTGNISSSNYAVVSWIPPEPGMYQITARFDGSGSELPAISETVCYYALAWQQPDGVDTFPLYAAQVTGSTYGDPVRATLKSYTYQAWGQGDPLEYQGDVSYTAYPLLGIGADGADGEGYSKEALKDWEIGGTLKPGSYKIVAAAGSEDSPITAACLLTVAKRALTITAPELSLSSEEVHMDTLADHLKEIKITETGTTAPYLLSEDDQALYGSAEAGYPGLFRLTSAPELQNSGGQYRIDVGYVGDGSDEDADVEARIDFLSKFVPTLQPGTASVTANTVSITCTWGENGGMQMMVNNEDQIGTNDGSGSTFRIDSNETVTFWSNPNSGYRVAQWAINGIPVTVSDANSGIELKNSQGDPFGGLELDVQAYLNANSGAAAQGLTVSLTFTGERVTVKHSVSESSKEFGAVTAQQGDSMLNESVDIAHGTGVTFTAAPAEGYVVKQWIVNGEPWINGDGTTYTANTLTLASITENTSVQVEFEPTGVYTVSFEAVDENGAPTSGATLTAEKIFATGGKEALSSGGAVTKGESVVFTAVETVGSSVQEWQIKSGDDPDAKFETVSGSGGKLSYTLNNVQADTTVRVVVSGGSANTYMLNFSVVDESGSPVDGGVLTARSPNGETLTSGQPQTAYANVIFTFQLSEAYEFVQWTVNNAEAAGTPTSCTLENPYSATTVHAVVREKPQVTFNVSGDPAQGVLTVDAEGLTTGGYVPNGTELTFTAEPAYGYEVNQWTVNGAVYTVQTTATDDQALTLTADSGTPVTVSVSFRAIPEQTVAYSVVDTNGDAEGGANGDLSASAARKDMEDYYVSTVISGSKVYRDSEVTFTALPASGYRVQEWRANGGVCQSDGLPYLGTELTLPVSDESIEVTVQFTKTGNQVTAEAGGNGKILSAMVGGQDQINNLETGFILGEDASVIFTAEPETGYEVACWTVNGQEAAGSASENTFTYAAETESAGAHIQVTFRQVEYSVSWTADGGTVTAADHEGDSAPIRGGTQVTFTAEPEDGREVSGWMVNGAPVDDASGNTFTWTVPNGMAEDPQVTEYSITAVCSTGSYSVTIQEAANVTVTASIDNLKEVPGGTQVTFTAVPAENYTVTGWIVNGEVTETASTTHTVRITGATAVQAAVAPSACEVAFSAGSHGSIAVVGQESGSPVQVPYGGEITFKAAPDAYYQVSAWKVDGSVVTEGVSADRNSFTLSNVHSAHTVTVEFGQALAYEVGYSVVSQTGGALSATDDGEPLTLTDNVAHVAGGSKLVFTAVPDAANGSAQMVKAWTVNGTELTRENMQSLGVTMAHPLDNTLIIESLGQAVTVTVEFEAYQGFDIPEGGGSHTVTGVKRSPENAYGGAPADQIRRGGDLTFTVGAAGDTDYVVLTKLTINGYDCLTGSGTVVNCGKVAAVKNADGTYTVTITGVTGAISTEIEARKLVITEGLTDYQIPGSLQAVGLNSIDKIQAKLETQLTAAADGEAVYDIALKAWDTSANGGQGGWVDVTAANFPAEGVDVVLPYPSGADSRDTFTIVHMLTVEKDSKKPGDVERVTHSKTSDGLRFHVNSLSPFAVSWIKYAGGGGGGGGIAAESYSINITETLFGVVTADEPKASQSAGVTLTVKAENGYRLESLSVLDQNGKEVELTQAGDTTYTFRMPASDVAVKALFLPESLPFTDVGENAWFRSAVAYAYSRELMVGTSGTTFSPDSVTSRAMIATILWRMEGSPVVNYAMTFEDVDEGKWYGEAIRWAASEGIVKGVSATAFSPDSSITREQLAAMLYRYAAYRGYDTTAGDMALDAFTDHAEISGYAVDSMAWAVSEGLITGVGNNTLAPRGTATRAQAAAMLMRFCEKQKKA